jgi:hypothetical protein
VNGLRWLGWLLAVVISGTAEPVSAWVYPEHRDIAILAVQNLDPEHRAFLDDLWRLARSADQQRLCELDVDPKQGIAPSCIDWAALSAIGGDHSCSSSEMLSTVLETKWILSVADIAAHLKIDLASIAVAPLAEQVPGSHDPIEDFRRRMDSEKARAARNNALRTADNRMQRADTSYATRAGSSQAHFLLARLHVGMSAEEYAGLTLKTGSKINALGVYSWYHLSALQKATRLGHETLVPDQRQELARAMLFDEAFALHFLEDSFAAGHIAGSWGNKSQRQGTHDYYNSAGLEIDRWHGGTESVVVMGDAHMRPQDAELAAGAARVSLEELLDTAAGRAHGVDFPHTPAAPVSPDTFDVCTNQVLVARPDLTEAPESYKRTVLTYLGEVLGQTAVPALGPGLGAVPRFRSELGLFVGLAGAVDGRWLDGGFAPSEGTGFVGGVELAGQVGVGLDGVMSDSGDGLVYLSLGVRGDTHTTSTVSTDTSLATLGGDVVAAIPSRTAVSMRLRMPFYLIPGDLLLLSPLYLIAPKRYEAMAVTAGNGGLIPWQSGFATRIGRFQFVLGRELGVTFYGVEGADRVLAPGVPGGPPRVVNYRSTAFDFPILEYRVHRSFSSNQSSRLLFQVFTNLDVPHSATVVSPPGAPNVDLHDVWSVGIRMVFDWRYYP